MTVGPKVVVVTGASSGIGRAVAHRAARAGEHLVLVARGRSALLRTESECETAGAASTMVVAADVADNEAMDKMVTEVLGRHGRIDAVVNSAGVVAYGRLEEVPADVFEGVIRTNLLGSATVARHVLPVLRRQQEGSLILIGSVIGHIATPTMSAYAVSKWGVRSLARHLQLENRDLPDVHVGYIAPGGVDTPIYLQAANYAGFVGRPPPPVASPEKVAKAVLHQVEHGRGRSQVGIANNVMRFGFTAMPWAFDVLVGPLFTLAAKDRTTPVEPTTGNVLDPDPERNRLHGEQGSALVGIARNALAQLGGLASSRRDA
ncbi:SDR family NAD(P)-dependent oxidoreductase [Nocardioides mesophilus]|uniref:SDR family NAD(P)-dependent oxidoreductase n=1 Tax=Nocardioides mesophilus TaxID=433659 RepID=A0A7G9RCY7_9ACTN|nr:SDR family NAD(P)-dependent oxidoreductase [Nocardioides mesophilus]QNN53462.1 SDR family NAD(P)-dependent oxidoreductase [Nocardioides mesophilus]